MLNLRASEWCGMAESSETLGSIRFGGFDLSVETGELRKEGVRLKLSGQAIEVLVLLVQPREVGSTRGAPAETLAGSQLW